MTAASFADDMAGGGGKYAAVFHIAGETHAETTSTELVAALSDPDHWGTDSQKQQHSYRRLLFGERWVAGASSAYPSDHVQIIPSLDADLGKQSIAYDENRGLSGGGWGVKFGRDAHGATYTHFRSGAVAGTYDGLDVMPDPIYDNTVVSGILAENWDGSGAGATLSWGKDKGLATLITDNDTAGIPTYIWIKNSCLAIDGNTLAGPAAGVYSATAYSGCLRTPREKIFVDQVDHSSHMLVSAPATTIVGKAATLWLVPMTDAGAIAGLPVAPADLTDLDEYTLPVMFRCGPVKPNPTCTADDWKIDCGFWEEFWDVDIPVEPKEGQIRGYKLHRQPAAATGKIQRPHLTILEYDADPLVLAYVSTEIWLCAPGEAVYYGTKKKLAAALNDELAARTYSGGAGTINRTFQASYGLLYVVDDVAFPAYINGPLAWILKLGLSRLGDLRTSNLNVYMNPKWEAYYENVNDLALTLSPSNGWLFVPDDTTATKAEYDLEIPGGMEYYYQWNFRSKYWCELNGVAPLGPLEVDYYPMAYYTPGGADDHYRLSIKHEFDAEQFDDEDQITVGGADKRHLMEGKVFSTASNYITVDDQDAIDGVTCLKVVDDGNNTIPVIPMRWGQPLYYWPYLHDYPNQLITAGDPFAVNTAVTVTSNSLSDLVRAILGDDPIQLPQRTCVYHIPDAWDDGLDMRGLVDYDRLDELAPAATNLWTLQLGTSFNLKKTVFNALLSLGIRQTWGYIESLRGYGMSFEPIGVVMASKAVTSGRVFDNSNLRAKSPSATYGNTWLYHNAKVKYNYNVADASELEIKNVTGRAMLASGNKTLKIDDKIIQVQGQAAIEAYSDRLRQILYRMNTALPSVSMGGTAAGVPLVTIGGDCLLTSDLPYDLFKGQRGFTRRSAIITKASINISVNGNEGKMDTDLIFRLARGSKAIGPAMYLTAAQITKSAGVVACATLNTDPALNEFASPLRGLTDLAYFGCFNWNAGTDTVSLRSCSCEKYAITVVDANTTSWDNAGAGRNVFRGRIYGDGADTLELADITNGTCKISIDTDYAEFDAGTDKIVFFGEYDNANLQQCQIDMYGWHGDHIGQVENVATVKSRAIAWS